MIGTSPKPRAQRKFASFASCCTLLKPQDTDFSSVTEIFPKFKPLTEDFLTFICFRGSGLLPPHLDFYALNGISEPKCDTNPIDDEKDLTTDLNVSRRTLANPGKLKRMGVVVNKSKKTHQIENQSESQYNNGNSKSSKNRESSETNSSGKSVDRNERDHHQKPKSKRTIRESLKSSNKVSPITTNSTSTTSTTPNKSHCKVQSIRTISTRQTVISPPKQESTTNTIQSRILKVNSFTSTTPPRKTRQSPLLSSSSSSSSTKVVTPIFRLKNADKNLSTATNGNRYSLASDRVLRSSHRSRSNHSELNLQMSKSNLDLKRIESKKNLRKLPLEDSSSAIYGIKKGNNLRSRLRIDNTKGFVVVDSSLKEKIVKKSTKVKSNHFKSTLKPNSSTKITTKCRNECTNMINGIITRSASKKPGNIQGNHH